MPSALLGLATYGINPDVFIAFSCGGRQRRDHAVPVEVLEGTLRALLWRAAGADVTPGIVLRRLPEPGVGSWEPPLFLYSFAFCVATRRDKYVMT